MSTSSPTLQELRNMYADAMNDEAITDISYWNEPNTDSECDEDAYLQNCLNNGDDLNNKLAEALESAH